MPSTSSAKPLELPPEPVVLHEEEIPDPPPTTEIPSGMVTATTPTTNPTPTTTPSPPTPSPAAHPTLLPVFQALAMVLAARLMGLLLVVSAVLFGYLTISDPIPLRLVAGAGYALFCLTALWVLPKR